MSDIDILVPVKDEAGNIKLLVKRIDTTLKSSNKRYRILFIDDHSTDDTRLIIKQLKDRYPVQVYKKQGKPGKAFSILEAARYVTSEYVVIIDGDLQYPPEAIPSMLAKTPEYGVVIARRQSRHEPFLRQFTSKAFKYIFGQMLFGFNYDIQSGLKVFKADILSHILPSEVTAWTLDLPLIYTAQELGYQIGEVSIDFAERNAGKSKIKIVKTIREIGGHSLEFKLKDKRPLAVQPLEQQSMLGAGLIHKRKKFITHTTLSHHDHALHTFTLGQRIGILILLTLLAIGLVLNPLPALIIGVGILSFIYFVDILFNIVLISNSLHSPPEIKISDEELAELSDSDLPVYTILCPLYRESAVLPHFVKAIEALDWPKDKLDVQLLLEQDDQETIEAAESMKLPDYFRIMVVPDSHPKTKPKACNFGLVHAKGEYLVIYDAEDIPDPQQLKKAYVAFKNSPSSVKCLQAKLNYFNPHQNILTRLFTIEYSLWFDITLPGLQSFNTIIPLGGTSNHFRIQDLRKLKGWDPFNVTEDCDLGVRLFKNGFQTAIIDSVTLEEANSSLPNWVRQRSRWIKGYMQTFLIHMRHPRQFFRQHGWHAVIFQLLIGGKLAFMLINPIMWILTISYFVLYQFLGPAIEALYPSIVFSMALFSLVFGNFLFVYCYMIGAARRNQWHLMKYVFLKPFYWIFVSWAAAIAFYQLLVKPHYWEKTNHGLHLSKASQKSVTASSLKQTKTEKSKTPAIKINGTIYIFALLVTYGLNFLYNVYLGRQLSFVDFGTLSLVATFLYFGQIFFISLSRTVTYHSAFLLGKYELVLKQFWRFIQKSSLAFGLFLTSVWLVSMPTLTQYFQLHSWWPLLSFSPVWLIGILAAVDTGFLSGQHRFSKLAGILLIEAGSKLLLAVAAIQTGYTQLVYLALPISLAIAFIIGRVVILRMGESTKKIPRRLAQRFPQRFFWTSMLNRLSILTFLGVDILMTKHFLSADQAGQYALLALAGKMIFFIGTLFINFIIPTVAKAEGKQTSSTKAVIQLLAISTATTAVAAIVVGPFGNITLPLLFGERAAVIIPYATAYSVGIASFTIAISLVTYYQARRQYIFSLASFVLTIAQIVALSRWHDSLSTVVLVMQVAGIGQLITILSLQILVPMLRKIKNVSIDFLGLFSSYQPATPPPSKLRFLMFNWRDTRHSWAGGAEIYIHEIAKQWVNQGHRVTVFCGNDGKSPRNEMIDGVQMIRRGGHYLVYFWAFIYYITRLRGKFDVIIDCENGIPFFTPLFVKEPSFLLIFHIHQQVFRQHLPIPLCWIAQLLEGKCMPFVYRENPVVTISPSSHHDIISIGLSRPKNVEIILPGVNLHPAENIEKTAYPSFIYIGRLKKYKNVDTAIRSMARIVEKFPTARLTIAGTGELLGELKRLTTQLRLEKNIFFVGKVSEEEKQKLLSESWGAVQPSSFEGWGLTVIEANACGTPVIASNVQGLKDSVIPNKTGILVSERNTKEFATAIETLINDVDKRDELSIAAKAWAEQFRWENSAQRFIDRIYFTLHQRYQEASWPN